jgi:hypothetical protein
MPQTWNFVKLDTTTEKLKEDLEKRMLTSPRAENLSPASADQVKAAKAAITSLARAVGKGEISVYGSGTTNEDPGKGVEMDFIGVSVSRRGVDNA